VLRLLPTPRHLPAQAVRIGVHHPSGLPIRPLELLRSIRRHGVAEVLHNHGGPLIRPFSTHTTLYRIVMPEGPPTAARRYGRARDPRIDARVLDVANRHLSIHGYEAMSVAAVAHEAHTTRQALYRRWPTKASLAAAALTAAVDEADATTSHDPLADLTAELANFQRGVSRPGRLSLVGTMLQDSTAPEALARYRAQVVAPRRGRLRAILEQARHLGLIDPDADLEVAVTMCTGSWYARALAGEPPPPHWPARTAALLWRAVGGDLHTLQADSR
jgi:AcrR family transcriptional regulator